MSTLSAKSIAESWDREKAVALAHEGVTRSHETLDLEDRRRFTRLRDSIDKHMADQFWQIGVIVGPYTPPDRSQHQPDPNPA